MTPDRLSNSLRSALRPPKHQVPSALVWRRSRSSGSRALSIGRSNIQLIRVPEGGRLDDSWTEIPDLGVGASQNVRRGQENERKIFRDQLLNTIVQLLSLGIIARDHLLLHQFID